MAQDWTGSKVKIKGDIYIKIIDPKSEYTVNEDMDSVIMITGPGCDKYRALKKYFVITDYRGKPIESPNNPEVPKSVYIDPMWGDPTGFCSRHHVTLYTSRPCPACADITAFEQQEQAEFESSGPMFKGNLKPVKRAYNKRASTELSTTSYACRPKKKLTVESTPKSTKEPTVPKSTKEADIPIPAPKEETKTSVAIVVDTISISSTPSSTVKEVNIKAFVQGVDTSMSLSTILQLIEKNLKA